MLVTVIDGPPSRRKPRKEHIMNKPSSSTPHRLTGSALRLLSGLGEPGASAIPDPSRETGLILRSTAGKVSLGRGVHPAAAGAELVRRDLAAWAGGALTISEAGRLHLRRRSAASDPFRAQHGEIVPATLADETGTRRVSINAAESPLDWMRRRKGRDGRPLIDAASYEAGERLRRDLTFGGLMPSVTARWEGAIGSSGGVRDPASATDAAIAARQRVRAALAELGGDLADLVVDLCGFLKGLETIERERGWPPRSAKVVVRLALGRLAEHYGLQTEARGPERSRGVRTWIAEEAA